LSTLRQSRIVSDAVLDRVWENCLEPMLILYYPPHRAADETELTYQAGVALRDYIEYLAEFPADVIREGWREARRAHKTQGWPTIQAIREACMVRAPRAQNAHVIAG